MLCCEVAAQMVWCGSGVCERDISIRPKQVDRVTDKPGSPMLRLPCEDVQFDVMRRAPGRELSFGLTIDMCLPHDLPERRVIVDAPDGDGRVWHDVTSAEINAYLKEISEAEVTAKDFRTWNATVLMAATLAEAPTPATKTARKRVIKLVNAPEVRVLDAGTFELLARFVVNPDRNYQRAQTIP